MRKTSEPQQDAAAESWYVLDPDDRITGIGGSGWPAGSEAYPGTRIYDHVAGHFTRQFLKDFLQQARSRGSTRQCYRCDSPVAKRLMEMSAVMQEGETLRVAHRMLGARALPFAVHFHEVPRASARLLRCSNCNRLRGIRGDVWREPEDGLQAGQTALVVHTVCPECRSHIGMRRQSAIFRIRDIR
jgi:hypothetical protein